MEQEKSNTSIVLVTGANSGIGYAQARMLLRKGYTVVGMDKKFDRTSFDANLKLYKDQSFRVVCNLADEKELKEIADKAISARKARDAAKKAREAVRETQKKKKEKVVKFDSKLADCNSKNRKECKINITEGK